MFRYRNFKNIGYNNPDAPAMYSYETSEDTMAQVLVDGYFSDQRAEIRQGDLVIVKAVDASKICRADDSSTISDVEKPSPVINQAPRATFSGDSITDFSKTISASSSIWRDEGWVCWFRRLMGDKIEVRYDDVFAVSGSTTDDVINNQLPQVLASDAKINFLLIGNNDNNAGYGLIDTIANYETYANALYNAGITLIVLPVMPHSGAESLDETKSSWFENMNAWLFNRAQTSDNFYYIDTLSRIVDFATGDAIDGFHKDGIHTTIFGAHLIASIVKEQTENLFASVPNVTKFTGASAYDDAINPFGNALSNAKLAGTGGSKTGGTTGDVADDYRVARASGATQTVTCSKTTMAGYKNLESQTITLGGTADGTIVYFETISTTVPVGWVVGDVVEAELLVKTTGIAGKIRCLQLLSRAGSNNAYYDGSEYDGTLADGGVHQDDIFCKFKARFTIEAGSNFRYRFIIYTVSGESLSCTIEFALPSFKRISRAQG